MRVYIYLWTVVLLKNIFNLLVYHFKVWLGPILFTKMQIYFLNFITYRFMKQELLKKKINMAKVRELMDVTFWHRRKSIIETRLMVSNLLEKYPALKDYQEVQSYFSVLTNLQTNVFMLAYVCLCVCDAHIEKTISEENL